MSYNPHKTAARLRRIATRIKKVADVITKNFALGDWKPATPIANTLYSLVDELRAVADGIKRPG